MEVQEKEMEGQETKNALWRREEQLKRWGMSDTNAESALPRNRDVSKVKFQDGCVFLAACSSGDKDEVLHLISNGANINTTNVDGLTALHQACIDENVSMVKFLVEHGACINMCDNEGWTALHATASCGFANIARYLIEHGANLNAVNNDGELAIDLAEGQEMENLLSDAMEKHGIDAESARKEEEEVMLRDANQWLNSRNFSDIPHEKTGATALHVASAKGYIKVMKLLLEAGADVNAKDYDSWTPLHAAAHWGQEEACKILVENFCDLEAKDIAGQTAFDVVDQEMEPILAELKKKQALLIEQNKDIRNKNGELLRGVSPGKRRSSITRLSIDQKANLLLKNVEDERAQMDAMRQPVVEEKDEERKSSEESDNSKDESEDASSSESDTEKQNEINSQSSQPRPQVNGSSHEIVKSPVEAKDIKVDIQGDIQTPPPKGPSSPPSASVLPKMLNPVGSDTSVTVAKTEPSAVVARKRDSDVEKSQPSKEVSKEPEPSKEKTVSDHVRTFASMQTHQPTKAPVSRATSAPVSSLASTTLRATAIGRQESKVETKPRTVHRCLDSTPSLWRASLRKTGSSGTVNECHNISRELDKIQRSVSIPRIAWSRNSDDSLPKKPLFGSGEETDQKNRFNELCNRYASLMASNGSTSSAKTTVTSPSVASATTNMPGVTTSTTNLSNQLLYGYPSCHLLRRRLDSSGRRDTDTDKMASTTSVASTSPTTNPESAELATSMRRLSEYPKRDDEKEVERKARAKRARESRRSTQGVSKEDLQKAEEALQAATSQRTGGDVVPERASAAKAEAKQSDVVATVSTSGLTTTTTSARSSFADRKSDDSPSSYRRLFRDSSLRDTETTSSSTPAVGLTTRGNRSGIMLPSSAADTVLTAVSTTSAAPTSSSSTVPSYRTQYRSRYMQEKEEEEARLKAEEDAKKLAATSESTEEKKEEKEDPSQKSAAIRAKKKRDSRRSTGRISLDGLQGPSQEEQEGSKEVEEDEKDGKSSSSQTTFETASVAGVEGTQAISSGTSTYTRFPYATSAQPKGLDYKMLYDEERAVNENLKKEMKQLQQEFMDCKSEMERLKSSAIANPSRSIETTSERRMTYAEKRALERKISELEEDLRNSESAKADLRADNQRLKDENGALIRVISKLSK